MQIEISDTTYQRIAARCEDVSAFVEQSVRQAIEQQKVAKNGRHFDPETVLAAFRDLEGMFDRGSLDEVLADRRLGRE
jgi:hypothetical protein